MSNETLSVVDPFDTGARPPVTDQIKDAITNAFAIVPEGKSSALLAIVDMQGNARLHFAWRVTNEESRVQWKVGAVVGKPKGQKPNGFVGVEVAW